VARDRVFFVRHCGIDSGLEAHAVLARRIGAIVLTGSVVRNSLMMVLHRVGFSTSSP
jgi:hypothetical protein